MNWRRFFRRSDRDAESARDLEFYLDTETEDNLARGMTPPEARAAALRKLGNPGLIREEIYRMNTIGLLETTWRDLLYALRSMRKSPGFTIVAVLTLGIGIGANTALFSVVNALLLRSLPLPEAERMMFLTGRNPARPGAGFSFSVQAYETWRTHLGSLSVTAYCGEGLTMTGTGDPERLSAALVAANFFDVLQTRPLMGRSFEASEGEPGGQPVVLISHGLWQQRFAADPHILGKSITLGQDVYSIIGVMPPDFRFPFPRIDIWATNLLQYTGLQPAQIRNGSGFLQSIARLKPGVTAVQAQQELAAIDRQYRREHAGNPDADPQIQLTLAPLQETIVGDIRPTLLVLAGVVGLVLLIACANVASLVLARATGRARELAVRAALGAGRGRLIRQLLSESLLLAAAGAALGILLARWGVALLVRSDGVRLPNFQPIRVDLQVLAFTFFVSLLTGVVFGLMPALQVTRPDLNSVMRESGRGNTTGALRHRTRSLLVAGQMALSIVLLIGAGLLLESFRRLQTVSPGFDPAHALTAGISLPPARYPDDPHRARFIAELMGRLQSIHGVRSASASLGLPLGTPAMAPVLAEGQPVVTVGRRPFATWYAVTPRYFETLGIPLVRGRDFSAADDEKAPRCIIVSQSLARRFWPDENPIGKHVTYAGLQIVAQVVGVAGDVKMSGLESETGMAIYTPYPQFAWPNMALTLRAEGDPRQLVPTLRAQVRALDRDLPIVNPRTLEDLVESVLVQRRQIMYLVAGFAGVAMLLAVVGLYGVMAYSVAQRTTEIGIRQAVGAQRADILRMILGQALKLSVAGIAGGTVAAWALTRLMAKMLFKVSATDPAIFLAISMVFLAVALAASYLPAWRATRVDPITALRVG